MGDGTAKDAYGSGRITAARRALADAVRRFDRAFTVEELSAAARLIEPAAGSLATAYRAIAVMEETGFVERVGEREATALYEHCDLEAHHHHIVCESCGRTAHTRCPIPPSFGEVAAESGFVVTRHEITLYGLCPACGKGGAS